MKRTKIFIGNIRMRFAISMQLTFLLTASISAAQPAGKGSVQTVCDTMLHELVRKHVMINEAKQSIPGWRVQIYFGTQRAKATEIKNFFSQNYTLLPSYLLYQQPYFKVRIGDCKTRLEAVKIQKQVYQLYPNAFLVKDEVRIEGME